MLDSPRPRFADCFSVRVLIVDDQPAFREAARELLEGRGHVVAEARDAAEALAAIEAFDPDAALIDVRLHDESGIDAARALVEASPRLAAFLMSADGTIVTDAVVRACGARGFVPKQRLAATDLVGLSKGG
jgi:DNA-binding NarL/FixJ family response regulator